MTRSVINSLVLVATFGLAAGLVIQQDWVSQGDRSAFQPTAGMDETAAGSAWVIDQTGEQVPAAPYQRIASASLIADAVLPHLVATDRIVMVTDSHRQNHPEAFRTAHAETFAYNATLEAIAPIKPDVIVISNATADVSRIERARELGYAICDLGPMQGRASLQRHIELLGDLLQEPERAQRLWDSWSRRMDAVAADVPIAERPRAVYVSVYNGVMYGGTVGSSYHDVLVGAGFVDLAADQFPGQGWPQLSVEWLLRQQPDVLVTTDGGRTALLALPGLEQVQALQDEHGLVSAPGAILGDPGLAMLAAAEALHDQYFHPDKRTQSDE